MAASGPWGRCIRQVGGILRLIEQQTMRVEAALTQSRRCSSSSRAPRNSKAAKSTRVRALPPDAGARAPAPQLERDNVVSLYDAIAPQWDRTRYKGWPRVVSFLADAARASPGGVPLVADVGCGNGRYMWRAGGSGSGANSSPSGCIIGCDASVELVRICRAKGFEAQVADALSVPYRSGAFDAVLSIAVLHHLSTRSRRIRALSELIRLLRPGGQGLVYAWAFEQGLQDGDVGARAFPSQDVFVPFHLRCKGSEAKEVAGSLETARPGAPRVDQDKRSLVYQRYCHLYKDGELEKLLLEAARTAENASRVRIVKSYYDMSNWCVRFSVENP